MKLVREYIIFEKFIEDGDPIHDMGIGFNISMDFKSEYQLFDWLSEMLPAILNTRTFPKNILNDPDSDGWYLHHKYSTAIQNYVSKYLTIKGDYSYFLPKKFHHFLKKKYPHLKSWMIKESLNEKFTEDSDPIHDMGIGIEYSIGQQLLILKEIDKFFDKIHKIDVDIISHVDFSGKRLTSYTLEIISTSLLKDYFNKCIKKANLEQFLDKENNDYPEIVESGFNKIYYCHFYYIKPNYEKAFKNAYNKVYNKL
jgi:hypothetical protein